MIQDSSRTKSDTQLTGRSVRAANLSESPQIDCDTRFCEFVVMIAISRFRAEHPELRNIEFGAQLKHELGQSCDQMLLTLFDRGGARLSEYEVQGTKESLFLRRTYRSPYDDPELAAALQLAETKWPSSNEVHRCPKCWGTRIAIAVRMACEDDWLTFATVFTGKACGSPTEAITDIGEKVSFLQSIGVDAFPVWIDESGSDGPHITTG